MVRQTKYKHNTFAFSPIFMSRSKRSRTFSIHKAYFSQILLKNVSKSVRIKSFVLSFGSVFYLSTARTLVPFQDCTDSQIAYTVFAALIKGSITDIQNSVALRSTCTSLFINVCPLKPKKSTRGLYHPLTRNITLMYRFGESNFTKMVDVTVS